MTSIGPLSPHELLSRAKDAGWAAALQVERGEPDSDDDDFDYDADFLKMMQREYWSGFDDYMDDDNEDEAVRILASIAAETDVRLYDRAAINPFTRANPTRRLIAGSLRFFHEMAMIKEFDFFLASLQPDAWLPALLDIDEHIEADEDLFDSRAMRAAIRAEIERRVARPTYIHSRMPAFLEAHQARVPREDGSIVRVPTVPRTIQNLIGSFLTQAIGPASSAHHPYLIEGVVPRPFRGPAVGSARKLEEDASASSSKRQR